VIVTVLCAAVLVAGLLTYLAGRHWEQRDSLAGIRPSGIPASVSTRLASLMGLSPVPARPAPGFTLTDQRGRTLSLASFRGSAVVLEFMDPHCVDICPIVSQEFIDAYRDLGGAGSRAVFVAVNVNPRHHGVSDVAAYSNGVKAGWTGPADGILVSGGQAYPFRLGRHAAAATGLQWA
jgi:cytochrome oxidase Cu insertion factor (SCO1/SenC/PrrC family)